MRLGLQKPQRGRRLAHCSQHFVWYNSHIMFESSFEWDEAKDRINRAKHGVSFALAQRAFFDPNRVIAEDLSHRGTALFLFRHRTGWRDDGAVHMARRTHPHLRRRILAKRENDL
jgi:hypothetical protein